MEYMLLIYADSSQFEAMSAAQQAEGLAAYGAYTEALQKAGALRGGNRLRPVRANRCGGVERYQLEAAVQSAHAVRHRTGKADWVAIEQLHDALCILPGLRRRKLPTAFRRVH